ncbi:hypothetical protein [Alkalitalea saponilacus]|uniref:Uncharacterized protein n=1 Tax=Alkalitalea saponilacus TaxID=889453 RepID=A0A1T5HSX0_9BACT|nr:hypothetical protein [Alkalitalea saponilacus]ASB47685.1 hypothetical protein CDL62_00210 [Alkalitalea saponilacus]SKC23610.1 hypothetical protein SAMN03080601_02889 [Alkalitalea saponilacus]
MFHFHAGKVDTKPGINKHNPKDISEGVHYARTRYKTGEWFRYTPNAGGDVMIATQYDAYAETTIQLFNEASGKMLASDTTNNIQGKEGRVVFNAEESVAYLIYIGNSGFSSLEGIYWDLKKNPQFCSAPKNISPENNQTVLGNTDYWFEYTASIRSIVNVAATGLENNKQFVDIEFYHSCDSMISAGKDNADIYLKPGEKVLIKTKGRHIEGFYDVAINETEQTVGTKEHPLEITAGNHQIKTNTDHWFVYYPQSTGKIEIDMPHDLSPMPRLEIYRPYNNSIALTTRSLDFGKAAARCKTGEPLYFRWLNNNSDALFEWTITEKETVTGDLITNALEALEGMNEMTKTNRMPTYYYYVPQSFGKIRISTCDLTEENTFVLVFDSINQVSTSIFSGSGCGHQSDIEFYCNPNDTIYLCWIEDFSNNPYPFTLSETPLTEGSDRRVAYNAIEGLNEAVFTDTNIQWFKYTTSIEGRLILSNCGIESSFFPNIQVFANNSNSDRRLESKDCGENQKTIQLEVQPGNTYYIKFQSTTTGTDFSMEWNLEEAAFEEGTRCSNAAAIDEGLHTTNSDNHRWYSYTAKSNAEITISRCNIEDDLDILLQPNIYKNCGQRLNRVDITYCGSKSKHDFVALKDSTYYITWGYISNYQFQWELSEQTYPLTGFCLDAKEVINGINHAEHTSNNDIWYKFTPPHDGTIILNSVGLTEEDTEVEFHSGCSDGIEYTEIYSSDRYGSSKQARLSWPCEGNETYYIRWKGDKITAPYNWEFIYIAKGDDKDDPLEAHLGINERTLSNSTSQYFAFGNTPLKHFYHISIPRQDGKTRKLNVLPRYDSWYDGIYFNADSTEAEIIRLSGGSYIIECISEPGDSFTWNIQERYMDTLTVNTRLLGHTGFINDWFVLSGEEDAYYTIESDKAIKANSDIELYAKFLYSESKLSPIASGMNVPFYKLSANTKHYLKWALPENGKTDYWWSLSPFHFSGSGDCFDAEPARPGAIYSTFNGSRLMYKFRPDKSGRYIINVETSELRRSGLERLSLYKGSCESNKWLGYVDFSEITHNQYLLTSIALDSITENTNYYLEWDFIFSSNLIKEFSWQLQFDADYQSKEDDPVDPDFFIGKNPNNGRFEVFFPKLREETTLDIYNSSGNNIYSNILQPIAS